MPCFASPIFVLTPLKNFILIPNLVLNPNWCAKSISYEVFESRLGPGCLPGPIREEFFTHGYLQSFRSSGIRAKRVAIE
jgi:hypothetical protein